MARKRTEPIDFPSHLPAEISATVFFYSPSFVWPLIADAEDIRRAIADRKQDLNAHFTAAMSLRDSLKEVDGDIQNILEGTPAIWSLGDKALTKIESIIPILVAYFGDVVTSTLLKRLFYKYWADASALDWGGNQWHEGLTGLIPSDGRPSHVAPGHDMKKKELMRRIRCELGEEALNQIPKKRFKKMDLSGLTRLYVRERMRAALFSFYGLLRCLGVSLSSMKPCPVLYHVGMFGPTFDYLDACLWLVAAPGGRQKNGKACAQKVVDILIALTAWKKNGAASMTEEEKRVAARCTSLMSTVFRENDGEFEVSGERWEALGAFASFPGLRAFFKNEDEDDMPWYLRGATIMKPRFG